MKVSVIIPAYNCELNLSRSIDSILNQTYEDIEIIIVDDGSTDKTSYIANSYADKLSNIKVIHQDNNKGAYQARLSGIRAAEGEWITFADADDILPNNAIELLCREIDNDTDIVVGTLLLNSKQLFIHKTYGLLSGEEYISAILNGNTSIGPYVKLFKRPIIQDDKLEINKRINQNEDMLMIIKIALSAKIVKIVPNIIVYDKIDNNGSMSKKKFPLKNWIELFNIMEDSIAPIMIRDEIKSSYISYQIKTLYEQGVLKLNSFKEIKPFIPILSQSAEHASISNEQRRQLRIIQSPYLRFLYGYKHQTILKLKRIAKRLINN